MNSPSHFVNYAHRGASAYCPENTLLSFYTGVYMGANGIETDVQQTRDGVLVLFHDGTMQRLLGCPDAIADHTWAELKTMRVQQGERYDRLVTLETFLQLFAFRDLTFAIEIKQANIEEAVVAMLRRYDLQPKCVITSFSLPIIERVRQIAPEFETGYLTRSADDALVRHLQEIGCRELCPEAQQLDAASVAAWKAAGLRVRAWGVRDEALMRHAYDSGVDGMTVNFPDKLQALCRPDGKD